MLRFYGTPTQKYGHLNSVMYHRKHHLMKWRVFCTILFGYGFSHENFILMKNKFLCLRTIKYFFYSWKNKILFSDPCSDPKSFSHGKSFFFFKNLPSNFLLQLYTGMVFTKESALLKNIFSTKLSYLQENTLYQNVLVLLTLL